MKKFFMLALVAIALLALTAFAAAEGSPFNYRQSGDGTVIIMGYREEVPSKLVIPSQIEGKSVSAIFANAFKNSYGLEEVVIPDSVTSIGSEAFANCYWLEKVTCPEEASVGARAFDNTPYGLREMQNKIAPQRSAGGNDLREQTKSAGKGAHVAGVIIGILIVAAAAFVYFAVLPKSKNAAKADKAPLEETDGTSENLDGESKTEAEAQGDGTDGTQSKASQFSVKSAFNRAKEALNDKMARVKAEKDTSRLAGGRTPLTEAAQEVKAEAEKTVDEAAEQIEEVKEEAAEILETAAEKAEEVKAGVGGAVETASEKLEAVEKEAAEAVESIAEKAVETLDDKAEEVKAEAEKAIEMASDKAGEIKEDAEEAVETLNEKADEIKAELNDKAD